MTPAPVATILARHKVADYFLSRDAVRINDAVRYTTRSPLERQAFERLCEQGIVRSAGNDTWFLDLGSYHRARKRRRQLATAAGAAVGAGVLALMFRRRR